MKKKLISIAKTIILSLGSIASRKDKHCMVYYHDVHSDVIHTDMSTPMALFSKHIETIRKLGYNIVREYSGAEKEVRIGFDDGFRGIYENRQFFLDNNIPATIFIPTSLIGQKHYLTEVEIKELENLGFNIQSHGVRHSDMAAMPDEILLDDLSTSKSTLEKITGKTIEEVCFPIGFFSDKVLKVSIECGYKQLFSSMPNTDGFPSELQGRLLFQSLTPLQAKLALRGGMNILQNHYKKIHYRE